MPKKNSKKELSIPPQLLWLADAPSFIDSEQVAQFYDAVVRPSTRTGATTITGGSELAAKIAGELGLDIEIESGKFIELLSTWLPSLTATGKGKLSTTGNISKKSMKSTVLHPIETPQRQLEQLVLHYLLDQRDRLVIDEFLIDENKKNDRCWADNNWVQKIPRGLALLDFPPGTKFIPTYAECGESNTPCKIYEDLKGFELEKKYPDNPQEEDKQEYWAAYASKFAVQDSVLAVEKAAIVGRIQVINFRVPITIAGQTLHLHLHPQGKFPTITFAYNMIRRGYEHGLRIVGTMRSEPDMNVLAVYEK